MKNRIHLWGTGFAMISMAAGTMVPSNIAHASANGKKNTAIGLGAIAAQQLLSGKTTNGLVLGAGAAYAYKKYEDAAKDEKREKRAEAYRYQRSGGSSINSRLIFTGRVTKDTKDVSRKIIVTSNGVERRLSVPARTPIFQAGEPASVHELRKGDIVRVSAVRASPTEWKALRIDVTSSADLHRASAYDTYGDRYANRIADDRAISTKEYSGTGIVRGVDRDNRSFDIQVGDNIRTIYTDNSAFHGFRNVNELREGDRVRIHGNLDGRDVFANDVSLLD